MSLYFGSMKISDMSSKEIGTYGERVAIEYLKRHGFKLVTTNMTRKTGEVDLIMRKGNSLHFVEVKTVSCWRFPNTAEARDRFDPSANIHREKIRKVARTAEWYVAEKRWKGLVAVDAVLVWLRRSDGVAKVAYLPQIL